MKNGVLLTILAILLGVTARPQDTVKTAPRVEIIDGDTVALVDIAPVVIFPPSKITTPRQAARYDRLVYNVRKVLPYAKLAAEKLRYYKTVLDTIHNEKARKAYLKKAEKELQDRFGNEIKGLTFSQGRVLIKLIYRETGNSTYDIVKELRGSFTAFIWQTLARLFGYNLKEAYDPGGSDQAIEQIVLMIEAGAL